MGFLLTGPCTRSELLPMAPPIHYINETNFEVQQLGTLI